MVLWHYYNVYNIVTFLHYDNLVWRQYCHLNAYGLLYMALTHQRGLLLALGLDS